MKCSALLSVGRLPANDSINGLLEKCSSLSQWCSQEDEIVSQLVQEHGARKWSLIASYLKGRIGKQCRER